MSIHLVVPTKAALQAGWGFVNIGGETFAVLSHRSRLRFKVLGYTQDTFLLGASLRLQQWLEKRDQIPVVVLEA